MLTKEQKRRLKLTEGRRMILRRAIKKLYDTIKHTENLLKRKTIIKYDYDEMWQLELYLDGNF